MVAMSRTAGPQQPVPTRQGFPSRPTGQDRTCVNSLFPPSLTPGTSRSPRLLLLLPGHKVETTTQQVIRQHPAVTVIDPTRSGAYQHWSCGGEQEAWGGQPGAELVSLGP